MRTYTIEVPDDDDRAKGRMLDIVDERGRRCDGLAFDELIGQVINLAHPGLRKEHYLMRTPEEWATLRARRAPPPKDATA